MLELAHTWLKIICVQMLAQDPSFKNDVDIVDICLVWHLSGVDGVVWMVSGL
jgi:hypothetical protein